MSYPNSFMPAKVWILNSRVFMHTNEHAPQNTTNPAKGDILTFYNGMDAYVENVVLSSNPVLYELCPREGEDIEKLSAAISHHIFHNIPASVGPSTMQERSSAPSAATPTVSGMQVVIPGYHYKLPERRKEGSQIVETGQVIVVTFLKTHPVTNETVTEGVFTEDVLKMLINRQKELNGHLPSREGAIVLTKLEEALMWAGKRQDDRMERGVHMTHQA